MLHARNSANGICLFLVHENVSEKINYLRFLDQNIFLAPQINVSGLLLTSHGISAHSSPLSHTHNRDTYLVFNLVYILSNIILIILKRYLDYFVVEYFIVPFTSVPKYSFFLFFGRGRSKLAETLKKSKLIVVIPTRY